MRRVISIFALMCACGDKGDTGGSFLPTDFEAGTFQLTNVAVDDACLDGAFAILYLPEGEGTENDWATTTELPAWDSLPSTYTIGIQEPFSDMEITVSEAGGNMALSGAEQSGVEFDADNYPGCTVDISISATLVIESNDRISGTADQQVTSGGQDTCPVFDSSPCSVTLDFYGTRL